MKKLYFVEPIVAVYAFAASLVYPLVQQYVYRRLWQELTNSTYPASDNSTRCAPANSSNHSSHHEEVQRAASLFSLYTELFSMIPSLIVTLVLVAYSDQRGRRITIILPLVGSLIYTCSFLAVSFFELNLYLLVGASFFSSLFGGIGTMLGGCFSYIADRCEDGKGKTLRMAGVDMTIGLLSGVGAISTGYFLRAYGFNWPFLTSALAQLVNLLYAVLFLGESRVVESQEKVSCSDALQKLVKGIQHIFSGGSRNRNYLLGLLITIFSLYTFADMGGLSMITLYELNEPLCWSEILIGYGSAISTTVFLTSFVGVSVLSLCLPDVAIVFIGMLSLCAGLIFVAFAKTTLMMFLVRVPMMFAVMPFPVMRAMMSKVVSKADQGSLFACVAFLESLSGNIGFAVFSSIYATTVAWRPGFTFLLAASLSIIPMMMLSLVNLFREEGLEEEIEPLLSDDRPVTPIEPDRPVTPVTPVTA
ncbi:lysosomal proton-coupled steroid conjugate and bile acid symporter SLC46A3 [Engraulis encrasicolus]|uniref:lysosomal proton-coupled steroid conjugate and bile acid symporter SLC46A3 n=1 Tax=Engraulis encrasicolus TaxID=184585 RepID=UPI002FD0C8B3